ncbi:rCG63248 [Rattus norvegicus]|uniref:RCG63248 n=1 Tax=Rattus norvegicus TaxID=10116 RepID=A6KAW0_RAT|nr:rCG63248 [Rattus norvegicus]
MLTVPQGRMSWQPQYHTEGPGGPGAAAALQSSGVTRETVLISAEACSRDRVEDLTARSRASQQKLSCHRRCHHHLKDGLPASEDLIKKVPHRMARQLGSELRVAHPHHDDRRE